MSGSLLWYKFIYFDRHSIDPDFFLATVNTEAVSAILSNKNLILFEKHSLPSIPKFNTHDEFPQHRKKKKGKNNSSAAIDAYFNQDRVVDYFAAAKGQTIIVAPRRCTEWSLSVFDGDFSPNEAISFHVL